MNISKTQNQHTLNLLKSISKLRAIESIKNDTAVVDTLSFLEMRLKDDTFRIASVGEFSSGKSTFINALIGRDLLLHARTETTAAITYVQNVGESDKRNGTGEVVLRSGKHISLKNLDDIGAYTTVQCKNNVAEEIDHVKIYVNFLSTDYPVVITDTPGFNGNKDHHSEISINEIKKTHACIYLIGLRGITNSDAELIKQLLDYQSTFFLLQNFKDEFNASEGDTIEKKIEDAERVVEQSIIPERKNFNYKLIGISALQAMAAKDRSIKFLKEGDTREIQDSERQKMLEESGMLELENSLTELINSGEYLTIIADSANEVLCDLLDSLISEMNRQQALNEELRANSDEQKRIEASAKLRKNIEETRDDRKKRLTSFIIARGEEQQRVLKNDIVDSSKEVYVAISKMIDDDFKTAIQNFSSKSDMMTYDDLFYKYKGKSASAYYTQKSQSMLNDLHKNLNERISLFINHLYEEALARVRNDTKVNVGSEKLNVKITADSKSFVMDKQTIHSHESLIQEYKNQITSLQNQIQKLQTDNSALKNKLLTERQKMPMLQAAVNSLESEFNNEIRRLGRRPSPSEIHHSEVRRRKKGGLLGLFGATETYTERWTDYDYSDQRSWDSNRRRIVSMYEPRLDQAKDIASECRAKIESLNGQIGDNEQIKKRQERKISDLREEIRQENEMYEELKHSARKKYLEWQKNTLKHNLEMQLLGEGDSGNAAEWFGEHIANTYRRYMPDITNELLKTYQVSVEKRLIEINRMEQENTAELEKRFKSIEEDIQKIQSIRETLRQPFKNPSQEIT